MELRWNIYRNLKQHVRTTSVLFTGQDPEFKTLANFLPVVGILMRHHTLEHRTGNTRSIGKEINQKPYLKRIYTSSNDFLYGISKRFLPVFVSVVNAVSQNCGL